MGTGHLGDGICLANSEEVLDLANVVSCLTLDGVPEEQSARLHRQHAKHSVLDNQKISLIGLVPEQRRPDQVAV